MAEDYGWVEPDRAETSPSQVLPDQVDPSAPAAQAVRQILDLRPDWQVDGLGLRGPQPDRPRPQNAAPFPMEFGIDNSRRGEGGGGGGVSVADEATGDFAEGETLVEGVQKITYDNRYFKIHDNGGGEVQVSLITDTCS